MEQQRSHQTKFISFAVGGPKHYTGRSMARAHQGMNLQPVHFDAICRHLSDSLKEFDVKPAEVDKVLEKIGTLRDDILYK